MPHLECRTKGALTCCKQHRAPKAPPLDTQQAYRLVLEPDKLIIRFQGFPKPIRLNIENSEFGKAGFQITEIEGRFLKRSPTQEKENQKRPRGKSALAIYHLSVKGISRGQGRSSVASAAYRSGEKLYENRTGLLYDYERRDGILHTQICLPKELSRYTLEHTLEPPKNLNEPNQTNLAVDPTPSAESVDLLTRSELWNMVEYAEKRKDAKVAREIVLALPCELNKQEQINLATEYAQNLCDKYGWAVDVAVHLPGKEGDNRNTHAHLLCTTRKIELDENGNLQLTTKTKDWDSIKTGPEKVIEEREAWADITNRYLEKAQSMERVDHQSYADQGLDLIPTKHLGVHASAMERKGIQTEVGDYNREAQKYNENVIELDKIRELKHEKLEWVKATDAMKGADTVHGLEQALWSLRPKSKEHYLREDKVHSQLSKQRAEIQQAGFYADSEKEQTEYQCKNSLSKINEWKQSHPIKAWLNDHGIKVGSKELNELVKTHQYHQSQNEQTAKEIDKLEKAENRIEGQLACREKVLEKSIDEKIERRQRQYNEAKELAKELKPQAREREREQDRGWER